jgi:hypothetical protein
MKRHRMCFVFVVVWEDCEDMGYGGGFVLGFMCEPGILWGGNFATRLRDNLRLGSVPFVLAGQWAVSSLSRDKQSQAA